MLLSDQKRVLFWYLGSGSILKAKHHKKLLWQRVHNLYRIEYISLHELRSEGLNVFQSRRSLKPQILTEKNEEPFLAL